MTFWPRSTDPEAEYVGEYMTSALDFIGILFVAIGLGSLVCAATGSVGLGLVMAGAVALVSSFLATLAGRQQPERSDE